VRPPKLDLEAFSDLPFPVAWVPELRRKKVVKITAMERELVVFWNRGDPKVYADACPHLGLPLSLGRIEGDTIRCAYHGWSFRTSDGEVAAQPTLRKKRPCRLKPYGALLAGDLVFSWTGDPEARAAVRERLPEEVLTGFSLYRLEFDCPFYQALFSSVDYAHFPYHTGYRPFYRLYSRFRSNEHKPGRAFPSKIVAEDDRRVTVCIDEADRYIHMYATCAEMDDSSVNFFQTYVTPISPMKTLYWECYRPRTDSRLVRLLARMAFRTVTTRLLHGEDRIWTGRSAPNLVDGDNIHLSENDVPLGAHLRKFVIPRLKAHAAGGSS
jgi:nitrite reductase/ring-hydroxylating ferredoxin subunit